MAVYRLKPHPVEAIQYRTVFSDEIKNFLGDIPHLFNNSEGIYVATLEGPVLVEPYMWIVKDKLITGGVAVFDEDKFKTLFEPIV